MKRLLFVFISCFILLCAPVHAEYGLYMFNDSTVQPEHPAPYMKHVSSWSRVEQEDIYLNSSHVVFHTNSGSNTFKLQADVMPVSATDKKVSFKSADETIAKVDENGKITAAGKLGDTVITVTSGKITKECKVSMRVGVKSVTLSEQALELYADKPEPITLKADIKPYNATVKDVIWYSMDNSIATVDENGTVIPCGVGETNIIAKTVDGSLTAACQVFVSVLSAPAEKAETTVSYVNYPYSIGDAVDSQMQTNPTVFTTNAYPAYRSEVEQCIDPQLYIEDGDKYQFLDLSSPNGVSEEMLNNYLHGKGVLDGMGGVFIEAARECGISEVYLAVHAALESGNGFSQLARGTNYNGTTVYNLFGIGAIDSAPLEGGSQTAYIYGWTSVEEAIRGGAAWISNNYINSGQNTLYKMRWNPEKPATHQYASDVEWAIKQARTLKNMFDAFPSADLRFEIPVYKGQNEPTIK